MTTPLEGNLPFSPLGPDAGCGGNFCGISHPCAGALTFSNAAKSDLF